MISLRKPGVDVAMLGARLHYALPCVLEQAGLLRTFYTDVYMRPWICALLAWIPSRMKPVWLRRLEGRFSKDLPSARIVTFTSFGFQTFLRRKLARSRSGLVGVFARTNQIFCERVVRKGIGGADAVYAFNGAAVEIFREAKRQAIVCILEQTMAPKQIERRLLDEESEHWPSWEPLRRTSIETDLLAAREKMEWELADLIVCGSEFVCDSLNSVGIEIGKCAVVPYGISPKQFTPKRKNTLRDHLNVLFIGQIGLRKGVPYLLESIKRLNSEKVHCRLVGSIGLNQWQLAKYSRWVEIVGPVPRARILDMYHWANLLVLPSLCEGSGLVTYEAMACGLPVITTPNSGSVIQDGEEGFIVPIRDTEAIMKRIDQLLMDKHMLSFMSHRALRRVEDFTVERYGERLVPVIQASRKAEMHR